jgi:hypothetical protein
VLYSCGLCVLWNSFVFSRSIRREVYWLRLRLTALSLFYGDIYNCFFGRWRWRRLFTRYDFCRSLSCRSTFCRSTFYRSTFCRSSLCRSFFLGRRCKFYPG